MGIFRINGIVGKRVPDQAALILQQVPDVNLNAVKNAVASFDPFDERSAATRRFIEYLNYRTLRKKFPDFKVNTTIKCDRSEPIISFDLITGKKVVFKASNLTAAEMFELFNKHITPHAPQEEKARETLSAKQMRKGK